MSSSLSSNGGNNNDEDENESAAAANGSSDANANGASDDGGKKRAAASVTASSASSSSASSSSSAGGKKRPRRSSFRRASATTAAAAAASAADNTNIDDDVGDSPSSDEDEGSGEEYAEEDDEDGGSNSDTDVEFVPKSGGRSCGKSNNSTSSERKAPARSSASSATSKAATAPAPPAAKSYPSDAEYLTAHRSTIDPRTLDRTRPIAGNIHLLKKPQLVKLLGDYHMSTSTKGGGGGIGGSSGLDVLKDRYRAFRMLYNAQCLSTRPAPIAQLVEQVHAEERAKDRERRAAMMNGSGRVAEEMRRLNAKWNEEKVDGGADGGNGDGGGGTGGNGGATGSSSSRAADIPNKMKSGFAALLAEGRKRCKEQGWRMGEVEEDAGAGEGATSCHNNKKKRKWEEDTCGSWKFEKRRRKTMTQMTPMTVVPRSPLCWMTGATKTRTTIASPVLRRRPGPRKIVSTSLRTRQMTAGMVMTTIAMRKSRAPRRRNLLAPCEHRAAPTVWSARHPHHRPPLRLQPKNHHRRRPRRGNQVLGNRIIRRRSPSSTNLHRSILGASATTALPVL